MKPTPGSVPPCRLIFPALAAALLLSLALGASLATDPPAGSAPAATGITRQTVTSAIPKITADTVMDAEHASRPADETGIFAGITSDT
jgi:hypothetical protein